MQVCICVGETILSQCPETSLSEYIPLYLQQTTAKDNHVCSGNVFLHLLAGYNSLMQQKLMHLYFYTVLEQLQTRQITPTQLVKMIIDTEKVVTLRCALIRFIKI